MTALMSLKSRLALARLALHVRPEQADVGSLAPVLAAGVDLLVLGSGGDDERDSEVLHDFREVYARYPILLAIDNAHAARQASADVVHVEKPGWKLFGGQPKGHEWTLLGRDARDERTVRSPGDDYAYLFVGPIDDDGDSRLIEAAVEHQAPFAENAVPWFALGNFTLAGADAVLAAGARRIALGPDVLDREGDPAEFVGQVKQALAAAWDADAAAAGYRRRAAAL